MNDNVTTIRSQKDDKNVTGDLCFYLAGLKAKVRQSGALLLFNE
jgi:hypothetical protein